MWSTIFIIFAALILIGYFVDREIYFYEGSHLSPRIQSWLYDRWARKYDEGKSESQLHDDEFLAKPLMDSIANVSSPFVLDVATGTGGLPYSLAEFGFKGHIVAIDISPGMLEKAIQKLRGHRGLIDFLRHEKIPLPFPDESFDVVVCLEALEVMQEIRTPISEFNRILRPSGILLTSRATEESGRKDKVVTKEYFKSLLSSVGFENIEIVPWWKLFDRVFARKAGESEPVNSNSAVDVLICPNCGHCDFEKKNIKLLICTNCEHQISIDDAGIIFYQ